MEGFYLTACCLHTGDKTDVIWFNHNDKEPDACGIEIIQKAVDDADIITGHNLKHDLNILRYYGVNFEGKELHCTMVSEYLLTGMDTRNKSYDLSSVAVEYGFEKKLDAVAVYWGQGVETYAIPLPILEEYVIDDTVKAYNICQKQRDMVVREGMEQLVKLQNEFIFTLSDIEMNGFHWNQERAKQIADDYQARVESADKQLIELSGESRLNLGSPQQLSCLLFGGKAKVTWTEWVTVPLKTKPETKYYEKTFSEYVDIPGLGFVPEKGTETSTPGYYSVDKTAIQLLKCKTKEQKLVKKLLLQRSAEAKVLETIRPAQQGKGLVSKVQPDGRIHPNLNQAVTATGRLSSSDPNSQNLPRGGTSPIKECITPVNDLIGQFDLSQIEWRASAYLSQDQTMIHEINNGIDQHIAACTELMELPFIDKSDPKSKENRQNAKIFNFRMIYGGSAYGFYMDHKMPNFSQKKWAAIVDGFEKKYYGLTDWQNRNIRYVVEGNTLRICTGRKFVFNKTLRDRDGVENYNERQIKNYPVQGISGGDILPLFAVILRRGFKKYDIKSKIILTVHDSIVFDLINDEVDKIKALCFAIIDRLPLYLTNYFKLPIPWNVKLAGEFEVGPNYGHMKEI